MADIFDEVDEILNAMDSEEPEAVEAEMVDAADKTFNESELLDIMNEIEILEKDSEGEDQKKELLSELENLEKDLKCEDHKMNLQDEIDKELEMTMMNKGEVEAEPIVPEMIVAPKVLKMEPEMTPVQESCNTKNSEISFQAHGQMNLNLAFKIGDQEANLVIDPVKGLMVTLSGVELCINSEEGCKVTMDNGVKFNIPLTSDVSVHKKKAA